MLLFLLALFFSYNLIGFSRGQIQNNPEDQLIVGFYRSSCPDAENIVTSVVRQAASSNPNLAPVLLRLHFHDCFVEGCDGSILINSGSTSDEKNAFGHQGVGGFDVIENAKTQLEAVCPGIVSCADIVALAARDALLLADGPSYQVETGRRDGMISDISKADDMPDVDDSILVLKQKFQDKGFTPKDLVLLSAAHTIGTTACFFMTKRLYNFSTTTTTTTNGELLASDPSINTEFLLELKTNCPQNGDVNVRLAMDPGSEQKFDAQILQNIRSGFAVLQSDAQLYQDLETRSVVDSYFSVPLLSSFEEDFVETMVKLGRFGVKTGSQGTIRRVCSSFD